MRRASREHSQIADAYKEAVQTAPESSGDDLMRHQ
eukprot:CAMPEP_0172719222 /NCGR_PEP_ID=MMETSP1074-20121228/75383_1 /TAXON_ID=2916 /ORGANISM="Ceratium fusus, Strain PA161109" /LENGTH=34 /DNA_ID= /DNA_START= /DNA_END= /DNA_ORIENTATION=